MPSKSDNIGIMINDRPHEAIEELFQLLFFRYKIGLKTSLKGEDFIFHFFHLLFYKCHEINSKLPIRKR